MNTNDKPVAVIILNWNGTKLLQEFLPSVVANTDPQLARIIVADNGSTDDSLKVLREQFPDVEVFSFDKNYGFAGGYNKAIEMVGNQYVVLLNSDVETPERWLNPLYDFMESHPHVGAVQPKILSYKDKTKFEHAGAAGGLIDIHGFPYCRGRVFNSVETDYGQYDAAPSSIFWATGASMMVRREVYIKAGGLDNEFFAHMEEIDLCWRMQLLGYRIFVVPESLVFHLGGGSLDYKNPRKTYLNFRNNLLMMYKNLPDLSRGRKLFVRRLLDTLAWLMYVVKFDFKNAKAIFRAHRDFAKMKKNYTVHPDVDLLETMNPRCNILTEHYIFRNR
ncbi:MAG: glycosyltransferase family 2 protein [Muribaculaceae bacterium]|nr:glycosyltransferase family 2 protein [Muribaculaceae bacterium]